MDASLTDSRKKLSQGAGKRWIIRISNPTTDDYERLGRYACDATTAYLIWQNELCPTTGTPHVQGFTILRRRLRLGHFRELIPRGHLERTYSTDDDNIRYCSKSLSRVDGPFIFGEVPPNEQGARTDLTRIRERIVEGATEREINDEFFGDYVRYHAGIGKSIRNLAPKRQRDPDVAPCVTVLWGPTGTGKSRRANAEAGPDSFRIERPADNGSCKYFEGYAGEKNIIIDDFYGWIKYDFMLRLLDRYPLRALIHYGSIDVLATNFWITSNRPPESWYKFADVSALMRRLSNIEYMGPGGDTTEPPGPSKRTRTDAYVSGLSTRDPVLMQLPTTLPNGMDPATLDTWLETIEWPTCTVQTIN